MNATRKLFSYSLLLGSLLASAAPAFAEGSVKVECWGNCSSVSLGQVCDQYSTNSTPVAIACDDTADPGAGTRVTCGRSTCTVYGLLARGDLVSAYCADANGNDAIVTCR